MKSSARASRTPGAAPAGWASARAWITSRRVKWALRWVRPAGPSILVRQASSSACRRPASPPRDRPIERGELPRAEAVLGRAGAPLADGALARDDPLSIARLALDDIDAAGARRSPRARRLLDDLGVALREVLAHPRRHADELGDPVAHRSPLDAERSRERVAHHRLGDRAGGLGLGEDRAHVGCAPAPVGALHPVGDHQVRVQVGIARARHLVQVHRPGEALARQHRDPVATTAHEAGAALEVVEAGPRAGRLGGEDGPADRLVADGGEHADALGRGEGEIEGDVAAAPAPGARELRSPRSGSRPSSSSPSAPSSGPPRRPRDSAARPLPAAPDLPALLVVVVAGELGALVVVGPLGGA